MERAVESSQLDADLSGVDRNVIGVAFDAQTAGREPRGLRRCDRARAWPKASAWSRSAVKEAELAQADHEAIRLAMQSDGAVGNFALQGLLQLRLQRP